MLLYRGSDFQAFAFGPDGRARHQGLGIDLRWRRWRHPGVKRTARWRHFKIGFQWPRSDLRRGRGTLTFEAVSWDTSPGVARDRVSLKAGVRLKLMRGGPIPPV